MKPYRVKLITALVLLAAFAFSFIPVRAQTLTPPPTPTPTFTEKHEDTFVKGVVDVIGEVAKYLLTGLIMVIAYALGKPRFDYWLERRKLRLQYKAKERETQQQAIHRRHVEDERLRVYLDRIGQAYNHTRVVGQTESIPLSDIFTEVYVLDRPEAERRFDIQRLLDNPDRRSDPQKLFTHLRERNERRSGLRFLSTPQAQRLFILGQPGAGKTTFLRYLTCQAAMGVLNKIPIFVTLREWMESELRDDLLAYIVEQFALYSFLDATAYVKHLLEETEDALVLFDGLDEVPQESGERGYVIKTVRDFARRYTYAQVLITCRVAAIDYTFEDFTYIEVADFTDEQVRTYARKWFRHSIKKKDAFLQALERPEHRNLRELARTPLLLGLVCLNFDETMAFPTRRVSLYTEALDALLKKWDSERDVQRDYQVLDVERKHQLFARLAYPAFVRGDYLFPKTRLVQDIADYMQHLPMADKVTLDSVPDGNAVLKAIEVQHGILTERAYQIYAFAHLTFQEYYTARYIVENVMQGTLPEVLKRAYEDRWREVILLAASMVGSANVFFEQFIATLDALICDDEKLVALFDWASRKAVSIMTPYSPIITRAYYIWFSRIQFNTDDLTFLNFDHSVEIDLIRDLEHDSGLVPYINSTIASLGRLRNALDSACTQDGDDEPTYTFVDHYVEAMNRITNIASALKNILACDLEFLSTFAAEPYLGFPPDFSLELPSGFARKSSPDSARGQDVISSLKYIATQISTRTSDLVCDLELIHIYNTVRDFAHSRTYDYDLGSTLERHRILQHNRSRALTRLRKLHLNTLATALDTHRLPRETATDSEWATFADQLQAVLIQHRDIGYDWDFSQEQMVTIDHYLASVRTLIRCFDVAYVTDRAAIEDRLLLPPKQDATA